ncbi:MAG: arsenate reductase ArsC [Candidatus Marinimicrobia bacterium]|nr:arsenate reductase ArsC [Candidatus Neomarinimicrobiota bacterium]
MDRNILFLCTGNSARSQMAAALLTKHAGDRYRVHSAGTRPAATVFPPVVTVMREIGLDLSDCHPKGIDPFLGRMHFECVITVCSDAETECPAIFGPATRLHWPFDDPAAIQGSPAEILAACRRIRDQIEIRILDWLRDSQSAAR